MLIRNTAHFRNYLFLIFLEPLIIDLLQIFPSKTNIYARISALVGSNYEFYLLIFDLR